MTGNKNVHNLSAWRLLEAVDSIGKGTFRLKPLCPFLKEDVQACFMWNDEEGGKFT